MVENPSFTENRQYPIYSTDITTTNFSLNFDDFYYKDNIIFKDLYCDLDDLLLAKSSVNQYFSLECDFNSSSKEMSCNTNATFTNNYKDNFSLIYNNETIYDNLTIYNSIDGGNYKVSYQNGVENNTNVTIVKFR